MLANCFPFLLLFPLSFIAVKCFQKWFPQESRLCFHFIFMTLITELWQEEVEIEAKVVAEKEILTSVVVEVRKKDNGVLIALGKQWMATLKNKQGVVSKLWISTNQYNELYIVHLTFGPVVHSSFSTQLSVDSILLPLVYAMYVFRIRFMP